MEIYDTIAPPANNLAAAISAPKPDPMAKAREAKAAKQAAAKAGEIDELAALRAENARLASLVPAAPAVKELKLIPGKKMTEAALQKTMDAAETIPTNAEESRLVEQAKWRLKQIAPSADVRIIRTKRGKFVRPKFIRPGVYEEQVHYTNPTHMMISGDDLADVAPGGLGRKFAVGDVARVTLDAAQRLIAQGLAEPA